MGRAPALAAALLALAACKVDVEGAPCSTAGEATDCPSGQACGNDGRCSERATTCTTPETRCTPGATHCAGSNGAEKVETCTQADPVCGTWASTSCALSGLVCGTRSAGAVASCECPTGFGGPEFAADPAAGSPAGTTPFPTGAASPAACRFKRLGDAIDAAGQVAGAAAVRAYGATGTEVVFDGASGDGPITIPADVTVIGATGASTTVLRAPALAGTALVTLEGALQGFEIDATDAGTAVATACGGGTPTLTGVAVYGGGISAIGIDVSGACGAVLTGVDVANVAGPAISIHADPSAVVNASGGGLRSSDIGARVTGGKVTFGAPGDPSGSVEISGNASEGLLLTGGAAMDARFYFAAVHGNGGSGFVVDSVSAGSAIEVGGSDLYSNGKVAPRTYGPGGSPRPAGGVLVSQLPLPFKFHGNRVYGNAGDQLAFESSDPTWSIAPPSCGASSNLFACVAGGAYAVGIAGGGKVDASYTVWPSVPFTQYMSAGVVISGPSAYCNGQPGVPPNPTCP